MQVCAFYIIQLEMNVKYKSKINLRIAMTVPNLILQLIETKKT